MKPYFLLAYKCTWNFFFIKHHIDFVDSCIPWDKECFDPASLCLFHFTGYRLPITLNYHLQLSFSGLTDVNWK